jgi:AraC family transcriptional regulator
MAWVESIQKSINYIEEHLLEELSIEKIAKQANVSVFHFQRAFTMLTAVPVGEYIRRRRLGKKSIRNGFRQAAVSMQASRN